MSFFFTCEYEQNPDESHLTDTPVLRRPLTQRATKLFRFFILEKTKLNCSQFISVSLYMYSDMAAGVFFQNQVRCSICLDVPLDPVNLLCGHSYCICCIQDSWNDLTGGFSCPECQHTPGPAFENTVFDEVLDGLHTMNLQSARLVQSNTGSEAVECDVCTGKKNEAVKSCVKCLKSYCQNHLRLHEMFFQSNKHSLINPTRRLNEMICPKHRRHLEIFCRTDQRCICCLCLTEEHTNHEIVAAEAERTEKQVLYELQSNRATLIPNSDNNAEE